MLKVKKELKFGKIFVKLLKTTVHIVGNDV